MGYKEFIQSIIDTRGQWGIPKGQYFEAHHIVPRCLGGKGKRRQKHPNIIYLYANEHYMAHKLLAKENPGNAKIVFAWWCMLKGPHSEKNDFQIEADDYRKMKEMRKNINYPHSNESNKRRKDTMLSKKLKWYTNGEDELRSQECPEGYHLGRCNRIKSDLSFSRKGKPRPKIRGEGNGMYGKHHTKEWKDRLRKKNNLSKWYTNGKEERFSVACPAGFHIGRLLKKTKWITKGSQDILISENELQQYLNDGWVPGRNNIGGKKNGKKDKE